MDQDSGIVRAVELFAADGADHLGCPPADRLPGVISTISIFHQNLLYRPSD
jgi:hypothetical protein